jgi:outer membrane lipoprotein-sorting protein
MTRILLIGLTLSLSLFSVASLGAASDPSGENRVLAVVEAMEAAFKQVKDYTCDVEQIFYKGGSEDQRYRFKFYFKKEKKIRVDFSSPYSGLTLLYQDNDKEVTVLPLRALPLLRFHYSVENPRVQTPAGQRIGQTDMGYFIEFLFRNLKSVEQREDEYREEGNRIQFLLWGQDYVRGRSPEKYRITISKMNWLPLRIERYTLEARPIEITIIENYKINSHLDDQWFAP